MRILILSQYWYPENGVPQRRWSWLTRLLTDAGHEVVVLAPPPHYHKDLSLKTFGRSIAGLRRSDVEHGPSGERIVRSGYLPSGRSLTARALNQAIVSISILAAAFFRGGRLNGFHPDVVIGTIPALPISWTTMFVAGAFGCPYVLDVRDAWPELLYERGSWNEGTGKKSLREIILSKGPLQVASAMVERLMYFSYRKSSGLLFTAKHLQNAYENDRRVTGLGAWKPMETIRNVFPPETDYTAFDKARRPNDSLNVLYAGTLGRAQKLSNALEAVRIAKEAGLQINLRLVGAGATRAALKKQVEAEDLPVDIRGKIPADDLAKHYEWADTALVHLTDWKALKAAIPSKTFELMQLRIHISGVVAGETAELIEDLHAGDVVAPNDPEALAQLWIELARDRERLNVGHEAAEWVKREREFEAGEKLYALLRRIEREK